jgi:hypothetical protein
VPLGWRRYRQFEWWWAVGVTYAAGLQDTTNSFHFGDDYSPNSSASKMAAVIIHDGQ